jgi:hypothetical protein
MSITFLEAKKNDTGDDNDGICGSLLSVILRGKLSMLKQKLNHFTFG